MDVSPPATRVAVDTPTTLRVDAGAPTALRVDAGAPTALADVDRIRRPAAGFYPVDDFGDALHVRAPRRRHARRGAG
ncbi:MAG TPA: hypothetical protein VGA56_07075 [Opitutaceae bacterium]